MSGRDYEYAITRLERAGADIGQALLKLRGMDVATHLEHLTVELQRLSRETADMRRAVVQVESGQDPKLVMEDHRARWQDDLYARSPYCESCHHYHIGRCLCPECGRPVNHAGTAHARCVP